MIDNKFIITIKRNSVFFLCVTAQNVTTTTMKTCNFGVNNIKQNI